MYNQLILKFMETRNLKFAEFTNSDSKLGSRNLCEDVKNFVPALAAAKGVNMLAFSGYVFIYPEAEF
jgi:hypothetical protein